MGELPEYRVYRWKRPSWRKRLRRWIRLRMAEFSVTPKDNER